MIVLGLGGFAFRMTASRSVQTRDGLCPGRGSLANARCIWGIIPAIASAAGSTANSRATVLRHVAVARIEIGDVLEDSPNLHHRRDERIAEVYPGALQLAVVETGFPLAIFPRACPLRATTFFRNWTDS